MQSFLSAHNTAPAEDCFAITPHDTNAMASVVRGIYVGGAGNITIITPKGTTVALNGALAGTVLAVRATHVKSTGTTATSLVGLV